MKVILRDQYQNPYILDDFVSAEAINARFNINNTAFMNLTLTKILPSVTNNGCQMYKFIVPLIRVNDFAKLAEGMYNITLLTRTTGSAAYPYFLRDNY